MVKIGIVDFDTSHVVAFTQRINHVGVDSDQWVNGAKVTVGCPGKSLLSPERIPGFTQQMQEYGVPLVDTPEEIIGQVDAVMIESVDGSVHYDRTLPFLEAGIPVFIDKPLTCSLEHAKALVDLARNRGIPIFSSSSLRYALEVTNIQKDQNGVGQVVGAEVYTTATLHPRNPGLFHYGIHGVEMLYALMGPGCQSVWAASNDDTDAISGLWYDGRIGTLRGIRKGQSGFGFTAYCEKSIVRTSINANFIYRELLRKIVKMFETGESPIDISESVEIVAFIEAAARSANNHGSKTEFAYTVEGE
ncbi:TPA: gfo/Idh/MocA family oxidoreductase [Candidatus Poribacteria bacterium]|nr:gfo/Idh/MocA family oxidoreductase [Candidatus Poribacteria bacterium]